MLVRWPGKIKPASVSNEIMSHIDWLPTLVAAAGDPNVAEKLKKGHEADGKKFKVHLDGHNFVPHLTGEQTKGPRESFLYFTDDAQVQALRYKPLENGFHGTTGRRPGRLARSLLHVAGAKTVRSANGPVRKGGP